MFYTLIKHGFLTNQSAQGPIYILIKVKPTLSLKRGTVNRRRRNEER